jgi:hypothetical protein
MREINNITALCPFNNTNRKINKKELVRFINTLFIHSTEKIEKIEKIEKMKPSIKGKNLYLINSKYKFSRDELEYYLVDEYLDYIR